MGKIISCFSAKGGVGKSSLCVNLGYALSLKKKIKVLLVDFDLQAGSTHHLSARFHKEYKSSLYEVLTGKHSIHRAIHEYTKSLHIIPISYKFYKISSENFGDILYNAINPIKNDYTYIFFDLAPSVYPGTTIPLFLSDFLIIPVDCQGALSILGLETAENVIKEMMQEDTNKSQLDLFGILPCFVDRTKVSNEVVDFLQVKYREYILPSIRKNTAIAQAASIGKTIFEYRSKSVGAQDYMKLCTEFLKRMHRIEQQGGK